MTLIADIHCHTFNADDIPARGFIEHVEFRDSPFGRDLATLVDFVVQGAAPGYASEKARLDQLLAKHALEQTYALAPAEVAVPLSEQLDREVDETFAELQGRDPALLLRLGARLASDQEGNQQTEATVGLVPRLRDVRRAIRFARLFTRTRYDLTRLLLETLGARVGLVCPLMVDLGLGVGDVAKTTISEQIDLQEKISRLSMLGALGPDSDARVHPFVAFDPRRELLARLAGDIRTPLYTVQEAITQFGFVGIKLYPPMGWKPLGNAASLGMTEAEASRLDDILRELYEWCVAEDVPITAHCNQSQFAHRDYRLFASPENWCLVLEEFEQLRLNLGHFGGARRDEKPEGWPWKIARAAAKYPHLYADVGNHAIHQRELTRAYFGMLKRMFDAPDTKAMRHRVMFGTDWYMLALQPDHERFLAEYESAYIRHFEAEATVDFLGETARRFLGFDDADNKNNKRLRDRYARFAPDRLPAWLATKTAAVSSGGVEAS